jgi:hypothetical protein
MDFNKNCAQQTLYQMRVCVFVETFEIFTYISRKIGTGCAGRQLRNNLFPHMA